MDKEKEHTMETGLKGLGATDLNPLILITKHPPPPQTLNPPLPPLIKTYGPGYVAYGKHLLLGMGRGVYYSYEKNETFYGCGFKSKG